MRFIVDQEESAKPALRSGKDNKLLLTFDNRGLNEVPFAAFNPITTEDDLPPVASGL